jgi:hypothetical protein
MRSLPSVLERTVEDRRTAAWDVIFSVDRPDRHYYLVTERHRQDRQGCRSCLFPF